MSSRLLQVRAAALAELREHPRPVSWQRDAIAAVSLVVAFTLTVILVGARLSIIEVERLPQRLVPLGLLFLVQVLGVLAAVAPGNALARGTAALLAAAATVAASLAILAGRGLGVATATPDFACSSSHLAIDLLPLGVVVLSLGRFSTTLGRSLLAGAAAAATGAIAGELSCGRGWVHVLLHHIGSGVAVALACVLLTRVRRPRTFAP